ncbi:YdcF family protein [Zavarzinia sp. CC-PAN008]|uniref:YdcF family protein n=1 Tax=Zavarzinia sp. CC-PAN008 TaxID=3243332 RepID=UPI003F7497AE
MSKILGALVDPANLIALLLVVGGPLAAFRRRIGRRMLWLSGLLMLAFGVLQGGQWIIMPLEQRFPANPPLPERVDGLILLGGAEMPRLSVAWNQPLFNEAGDRVAAFAALALAHPEARLVVAGGSNDLRGPADWKESEVSLRLLEKLGIPRGRAIVEEQSRNTRENAVNAQALANPRPGETWVLVTSAAHIPRSVGIFRQVGWEVIPYPTDFRALPDAPLLQALDVSTSLGIARAAAREWVGMAYYYAMGWTSDLFPGPLGRRPVPPAAPAAAPPPAPSGPSDLGDPAAPPSPAPPT